MVCARELSALSHSNTVTMAPVAMAYRFSNSKHCFTTSKLYDILPPSTAIADYATGLEKLSANEQLFDDAQTGVRL